MVWCVPGFLCCLWIAYVGIADARWPTAEAEEEMGLDLVLLQLRSLRHQLHQRRLPNVRRTSLRLLPRGENPDPRVDAVPRG